MAEKITGKGIVDAMNDKVVKKNATIKDPADKLPEITSFAQVADAVRNDIPALRAGTDLPSETDIRKWHEQLDKLDGGTNAFINALVMRIGRTIIRSKVLTNPLAMFKKGQFPLGKTIQEVFVDIAKVNKYDMAKSETDVFKRTTPDVHAMYHHVNREEQIPATITREKLLNAFTSWDELGSFIASILQSMYNANNVTEFQYMKILLDEATEKSKIKVVKVPAPTSPENGLQISTAIKKYSNRLIFPSRQYNGAGVMTLSAKDDQFLLVTGDTDAYLDVNVLANAFNMNKADFMGHKVMIDFLENTPNLVAILIDRDFFMVYDQLLEITNQYNGMGMWTNYWLQIQQVMSASLFANAVAFKYETDDDKIPDISSVVISPVNKEATAGDSVDYTVVVKKVDEMVDGSWTITTSDTTLTVDKNVVTIPADHAGGQVTVTATANHKETDGSQQKGIATLTIKPKATV